MGMFDTVCVICPHCNKTVKIQTKYGPCKLNKYHQGSVPVEIAVALVSCDEDDAPEECTECKEPFRITTNAARRVAVYASKIKPGEDDYD
jgi:hypothetical protein